MYGVLLIPEAQRSELVIKNGLVPLRGIGILKEQEHKIGSVE